MILRVRMNHVAHPNDVVMIEAGETGSGNDSPALAGEALHVSDRQREKDDAELVRAVGRGESWAMELLIDRHGQAIRRLITRLMGWQGDVEDVVQEVVVRVMLGAKQFAGESKVSTWMMAIALNYCRSVRRRIRTQIRHLKSIWLMPARVQATREPDEFEPLRRCIGKLGQADRNVIVLHHFEEMEIGEIAGLLKISVNAATVRLSRARQRLKVLLETK